MKNKYIWMLITIIVLLQTGFLFLKLFGKVDWNWLIVFIPVLLPATMAVISVIIILSIDCFDKGDGDLL